VTDEMKKERDLGLVINKNEVNFLTAMPTIGPARNERIIPTSNHSEYIRFHQNK
jgi:hypothetical protein